MCGRYHLFYIHHRLRHILSQEGPQVTKTETHCWQCWGLLCLLGNWWSTRVLFTPNLRFTFLFWDSQLDQGNISVRSNNKTISLSNNMGFGTSGVFFLQSEKICHLWIVAIFEKHKMISKDAVQEPIWKDLFMSKQMEFGLIVELNCHMEQNTADYCININVNMLHHSVVIVATVVTRL